MRNRGSGASNTSTLRYYRSTDRVISSADAEVGTESVSVLAASESSTLPITTNNCSVALSIEATASPDLVVDAPTANNADLLSGQVLDISVTVRNRGDGPSGTSKVRFYSSTDTTISSSDTELLWDWVGQMSAADSRIVGTRLTAPSNSGTYYYGVCVDAVPGESNVTNNCSAALKVTVLARPDMVVDEITVSDTTLRRRFHFTVSATVQNQGGGPSSPVNIHFYHSLDSTITTTDDEVATKWSGTDEIPPAGVVTQAASVAAPWEAGTHYYGACVFPSEEGDSNPGNNCSTAVAITVLAEPDLVVDSPAMSDSNLAAGQSFTLSVTVHNYGNASSDPTTLRYNRSIGPGLSGFQEVGTGSVDGLSVSGSSTESITLTAPSTPGTYYYHACVDVVAGEVEDALFDNCSDEVSVTVASASSPGAPTGLTATTDGQTEIDLSWTAPSDDGGAAITGYRIEVSTDGSSWSDLVVDTSSTATSYSHTGLTAGSARYYRVSAINSAGTGPASNTDSATTDRPGPDLVADTPTISDSHPTAGTSFGLIVAVHNRGNAASEPTTLRLYSSTDSTITTSDELSRFDGSDVVTGLNPTETAYLQIVPRAPSTPGTYYYGACVVSVTDESNIGNNCSPAVAIIAVDQPDLVVETPWISHSSATAVSVYRSACSCT